MFYINSFHLKLMERLHVPRLATQQRYEKATKISLQTTPHGQTIELSVHLTLLVYRVL